MTEVERAAGLYWVKASGKWTVGEWVAVQENGSGWHVLGWSNYSPYFDGDLDEVGPQVKRPALEKQEFGALLADRYKLRFAMAMRALRHVEIRDHAFSAECIDCRLPQILAEEERKYIGGLSQAPLLDQVRFGGEWR